MKFILFVLLVAITISFVSAFYSVVGLTAIFSTQFWPIVIMGSVLELGKICATLWLHKYWKSADWKYKAYLIPAIVILMFITALGTYGYLSKAHLDQTVPSGDISDKVLLIDEKIKTNQDIINASRTALIQLDNAVNETLSRSTSEQGAAKSVQIRKTQSKERTQLHDDIEKAQNEISRLREERAPIATQLRKVEAEVGPIKYIAALVYGDNLDSSMLENSVRWLIILIVSVFDPLAVMLLLACQHGFNDLEFKKLSKPENTQTPSEKLASEFIEDLLDYEVSDEITEQDPIVFFEEVAAPTVNTHGDVFPENPDKGQEFTRTDYKPSRTFIFNGTQWVAKQ